jgi:hypothetical protein
MSKSRDATNYLRQPFYRRWTLTAQKRIAALGFVLISKLAAVSSIRFWTVCRQSGTSANGGYDTLPGRRHAKALFNFLYYVRLPGKGAYLEVDSYSGDWVTRSVRCRL